MKMKYDIDENVIQWLNGETKTVVEWCEQYGLNQYTVYDWIRRKGASYAEQRISEIA